LENQTNKTPIYDVVIRLLLILLITGWCLLIIYPFASVLLWSLILTITLSPLHHKLSTWLKGSPKIAATLLVLLFFIIIFIPCWLLIGSVIDEARFLKESYDNNLLIIPPAPLEVKDWPLIGNDLYNFWQSAASNLKQLFLTHQEKILEVARHLGKIIINATGGVVQIMLSVAITGVLLAVGGTREAIHKFFRKVGGIKGDALAEMTIKVIGNVVKGIIGESFIMAVLHGILFALVGIPFAGIWTILVFLLAMLQLPVLIVTGPIFAYFFISMETGPAIAWSIALILVSLTDNVLTPIMLGKGAPVPMVVIFIGAIGGLLLSGFIGLFTGAVVMSLGYTLFMSWIQDGYKPPDGV
jgi:predicted PurR-regulated permease PerM